VAEATRNHDERFPLREGNRAGGSVKPVMQNRAAMHEGDVLLDSANPLRAIEKEDMLRGGKELLLQGNPLSCQGHLLSQKGVGSVDKGYLKAS
jgi:hypothetical protein